MWSRTCLNGTNRCVIIGVTTGSCVCVVNECAYTIVVCCSWLCLDLDWLMSWVLALYSHSEFECVLILNVSGILGIYVSEVIQSPVWPLSQLYHHTYFFVGTRWVWVFVLHGTDVLIVSCLYSTRYEKPVTHYLRTCYRTSSMMILKTSSKVPIKKPLDIYT